MEPDAIAALPIRSYSFWWDKQIDSTVRNKVRKAQKQGIIVKLAIFDDAFVQGMTSIFNETPIRQGRRFLHYGKDFATVKKQFSRLLFREELFGAYLGDEQVGFIMLADAGRYAFLGQIKIIASLLGLRAWWYSMKHPSKTTRGWRQGCASSTVCQK